jgi:dipeptidyl aminopeptidase/acylaminoacyl peptidase
MREEDLLRFEWIADPQMSPDGSRIAFTRVRVDTEADEYRTSLWLIDAGDGPAEPRALTFGDFDGQPRWSPDGAWLAFTRKTEKEKPPQLFVLPMTGGEPRRLTDLEKGASEPAWSPDGKRLAFTSGTNPAIDTPEKKKPKNEPGRVVTRPEFRMNNEGFADPEHLDHVWVVDLEGGAPRQLTTGDFKETSPRWSRDGKWILFLSDRRPEPWFAHEDSDLFAVSPALERPTDGAELRAVADIRGPIYAWSEAADGRIAAVGGIRPEQPHSYDQNDLLVFEGAWPRTAPQVLTSRYDFDVQPDISSDQHPPRGGGAMPLGFAPDGKSVITVIGRHGSAMLSRVAIAGGAVDELTDAQHEVVAGSISADGRRVALAIADLTKPAALAVYDADAKRLTPLWDANAKLLGESRLGEIEEIWYPSFDGKRIQGWIVKPPDFDPKKRYPLILEIHGGPHVAYGVGFFHEFRVLAAAGYVVLYTNPRGSTTYGQEFGNCIQYRYPGDDHQDLMAGVDHVIARGYVDPEKLGITGGSGGGLLTNWAITQTDRFAAAITQRCVSDWASMWYSCDFSLFTPAWFRKAPFEDSREHLDRSPANFVSKITTPLLVIHSEEDWRTPIGQGETMFRALKYQRKPVAMVRFPGENHELSRSGAPSRRVQNQQVIRRWFDHWLQGKPAPEFRLEASSPATVGSGAKSQG